jgi:hypothetical protein
MDTTDPGITFDYNGDCNHCKQYLKLKALAVHPEQFNSIIEKLQKSI